MHLAVFIFAEVFGTCSFTSELVSCERHICSSHSRFTLGHSQSCICSSHLSELTHLILMLFCRLTSSRCVHLSSRVPQWTALSPSSRAISRAVVYPHVTSWNTVSSLSRLSSRLLSSLLDLFVVQSRWNTQRLLFSTFRHSHFQNRRKSRGTFSI